MKKIKPATLLPFHVRIIGEMTAIHNTLKGPSLRAMRALHEISTTTIPREHVDEVREAMNGMLGRLGGALSRRFTRTNRIVINRAARALKQQEQEPVADTVHADDHASGQRASGSEAGEHRLADAAGGNGTERVHRPVPRIENSAAA